MVSGPTLAALWAPNLERNGVTVGTLQTWGSGWDVFDAVLNKVASHTTIRAAVRVAGKVL